MNVAIHSVSICAGTGMLEEGVRIACEVAGLGRLRTVCYVEREAYAAALLVARMEAQALDQAPIWDDVKTFDGTAWAGDMDILIGGYPCQPFSVAGKQLGTEDPRHLWPYIAEVIRQAKPKLCFFENVRGHLRLGFEQVHDELRSMGYSVRAGLFTAEEVGASHERCRLFILAYRTEAGTEDEGIELANSNSKRLEGSEPQRKRNSILQFHINGSQELGNSNRSGLQGRVQQGRELPNERTAGSSSYSRFLPVFAHGPGELAKWERTIGGRPDLAPAVESGVRLLADGMAPFVDEHRVDQLVCAGNGVVPLQAAYAFTTLARSAGII